MTTFNVYRRDTSEDTPVAIATGVEVTNYVDTTAAEGRTYLYSIGAFKDGHEKISPEILVSTVSHAVLSLFKNAEKGLWLDFSDMSSLYQDSTGTVSVTAVSQPIGKVLDKSGNSNHAAQTASSRRPVFQTDGAFFDGVDDFLKTITAVNYGQTSHLEIFVKIKSVYKGSESTYYGGFVFESGSPTFASSGPGGFCSMAPEENYLISVGLSTGSSNVAAFYPGSGRVYDGVYLVRINNSEVVLHGKELSYSTQKTGATAIRTDFLNIGARTQSGEPVFGFYGYIKHLVIVNRELTALERSNLTAFLEAS